MTADQNFTERAATRLSMPLGEAMFSARAMRRLRPDPIPDEALHDILLAATQAPSGGNTQTWHFMVIRDPERRRAFGALYLEAWWAKRADFGMATRDDFPEAVKRMLNSAADLAEQIGEAPAIVLLCDTAGLGGAYASVVPAAQNLLLAARALGIGGLITTLHPTVDDRVKALLEMPPETAIVYALPLGYPEGRFGPLSRRPLDEVASIDTWGNPPDWT